MGAVNFWKTPPTRDATPEKALPTLDAAPRAALTADWKPLTMGAVARCQAAEIGADTALNARARLAVAACQTAPIRPEAAWKCAWIAARAFAAPGARRVNVPCQAVLMNPAASPAIRLDAANA